jgi:hypothetical protein
MDGSFAEPLFAGGQPSTAAFGEPISFRHYLHCLRQQAFGAGGSTFDDTVARHTALLATAQGGLEALRKESIVSPERGFAEAAVAKAAALAVLKATRGPILKREWRTL